MTDRELCNFGERLYEAVLYTPLPSATIFNLALAVRQAVAWEHLPQALKFAVFKIAASCVTEEAEGSTEPSATDGQAESAPEASHVTASSGGEPPGVPQADVERTDGAPAAA